MNMVEMIAVYFFFKKELHEGFQRIVGGIVHDGVSNLNLCD
jgi:hypothetical protein